MCQQACMLFKACTAHRAWVFTRILENCVCVTDGWKYRHQHIQNNHQHNFKIENLKQNWLFRFLTYITCINIWLHNNNILCQTYFPIFPSEKMTPHLLSPLLSPALEPEEVRARKMNRRAKVIQELVQTEKDFLTDLELCIREVVQPLRKLQVDAVTTCLPLINVDVTPIFQIRQSLHIHSKHLNVIPG